MNIVSAKEIEKYLSEYSLGIDYWDNQAGDTFLILGARELLQNNLSSFNKEQCDILKAIDLKAQNTLLNYNGDETFDVQMLRDIVAVINHGSLEQAA